MPRRACALQYVTCKVLHSASFFTLLYEVHWRNEPSAGVVPTHQRLHTGETFRLQVDLRLVNTVDFANFHGLIDAGPKRNIPQQVGLCTGLSNGDRIVSFRGFFSSCYCCSQARRWVTLKGGDAEGYANVDRKPAHLDWSGKNRPQPLQMFDYILYVVVDDMPAEMMSIVVNY